MVRVFSVPSKQTFCFLFLGRGEVRYENNRKSGTVVLSTYSFLLVPTTNQDPNNLPFSEMVILESMVPLGEQEVVFSLVKKRLTLAVLSHKFLSLYVV